MNTFSHGFAVAQEYIRLQTLPLFESSEYIDAGNPIINQHITALTMGGIEDAALVYELASDLLFAQRDNENSYKSFRSEITSFLHWCFDVYQVSPANVTPIFFWFSNFDDAAFAKIYHQCVAVLKVLFK